LRNRNPDTKGIGLIFAVASCLFLPLCFSIFLCFECASDEGAFENALDLVEEGSYSQAVEALEQLIPETKNPEMRAKYHYLTATCYRKSERWAKAASHYQSALEEDEFPFADLARRHIAAGYQNLYNYGAAVKWYEAILSDHSDGFSAQEAQYQLGECFYKMGKHEAAIRHYKRFCKDYPKDRRVREAVYQIGRAYQELEKWSEAYITYQGMLRQNVKGQLAKNAANNIRILMFSHPNIAVIRDDRMHCGLALYYAGQYKAAQEELGKAIDAPDDLSAKAAFFVAESYYRKREYEKAIAEYTAVATNYPKSEYAVTAQYQIPLCHRKMGRTQKASTMLAEFADAYPENALADNATFQIAEYQMEKEQYKKAADAYGEVLLKHSDSNLIDDALWNIGWCAIKLNERAESELAFRLLLSEYPDSSLAGSARFWMGVNYEKMEKWQAAVDAYKETISNNTWYYSDRAVRRIQRLIRLGKVGEEAASIQHEKLKIDESAPAWQNINAPIPVRIQELLSLRIFDDATDELLMAAKKGEALESIYYNLSACYKKQGDHNNSWRYAWRLSRLPGMKSADGAMPRQLHRMLYPLAFRDAVFSNSEKNDLDPLLVMALMTEESKYDPSAVSWVGALGLIQIMPPTGREIAQRLKFETFDTKMLLHPETNIKMGTWYLAGLANRLGKHVKETFDKENMPESERSYITQMLAAGAYNGGESRIRRWVKRYGVEDIDEFVESIPIQQTRRYIKKVCNSYEVYNSLYNE